ncbi:MAG: hypothetical protein WAX66_02480 [Patescibacteria group bacterium]
MLDLLKSFYLKVEGLKGKKLITVLIIVFISFIFIGILVGYLTSGGLKEDEKATGSNMPTVISPKDEKSYFEGKVTYVDPQMYPLENISYALTDFSGKEMFLLKSNDQKLSLAENLNVKVSGKMGKLNDGKTNVLFVEEVIIRNASD